MRIEIWPRCWSAPRAAPVPRNTRSSSPDAQMFGENETITAFGEDTLPDLARRYSLGYEEIQRANPGVDVWLPGEGTTHPAARAALAAAGSARRHRRQSTRAPSLLLPEGEEGRDALRHHLSGEHRQDGLEHAARQDARHRQAQEPDAGVRRSRCARSTRNAAIHCRRWSRRGPTIRSAPTPCGSTFIRAPISSTAPTIRSPWAWRSRTAASACIRRTSRRCSRWCR